MHGAEGEARLAQHDREDGQQVLEVEALEEEAQGDVLRGQLRRRRPRDDDVPVAERESDAREAARGERHVKHAVLDVALERQREGGRHGEAEQLCQRRAHGREERVVAHEHDDGGREEVHGERSGGAGRARSDGRGEPGRQEAGVRVALFVRDPLDRRCDDLAHLRGKGREEMCVATLSPLAPTPTSAGVMSLQCTTDVQYSLLPSVDARAKWRHVDGGGGAGAADASSLSPRGKANSAMLSGRGVFSQGSTGTESHACGRKTRSPGPVERAKSVPSRCSSPRPTTTK